MESASRPKESRYRLVGERKGVSTTFVLSLGTQRVGSSPESDFVLAASGVSREHAVLLVTPESLSVEDRGSKNGTRVDGQLVQRHALYPGTHIAFGPVAFEVEEVEVADLEIGVRVQPGPEESPPETPIFPSADTLSLPEASRAASETWILLLDGFVGRLNADHVDLNGALAYMNETLGARGSCLVEQTEKEEPLWLAAQGFCGEIPSEIWTPLETDTFRTCRERTLAILRSPGPTSIGLAAWGDFPHRTDSAILFRLLLHYLTWSYLRPEKPEPRHRSVARAGDSELIFPEGYVAGISPVMTVLYRQMRVVASRDIPVLIVGETGVGKEQLMSALHHSSGRRKRPLVVINCAAIPVDLLEAELFGIDKGVATGVDARPGKFQLAEGGTLCLDEVGEMMPALQAKLLRALQEKEIQPVGGKPRTVDVRIVAATNADLEDRMEQGEFRRDLYYRLAGEVLRMPPLRERPEDLPLLAEHFLRTFSEEAGVRVRGMTVKALQLFAGYPWPGNVRELQYEIRRLVHNCSDGGVIDSKALPGRFRQEASRAPRAKKARPVDLPEVAAPLEPADSLRLAPLRRELEMRLVREALRRTEGRKGRAAGLLGISRNGLADKIKRFGIDVQDFRAD